MVLTFEEFVATYKPIQNPFNPVALYDGTLFSTLEFSRISTVSMPSRTLWTLVKVSEYNESTMTYDEVLKIHTGLSDFGDIQGYFVTEVPYDYGQNIEVTV